jgi:hypothetical protein
VTLSACTTYDAVTCPYPNLLFYQDPAAAPALDPSGNMWVNQLRSNSGAALNGSIYFPTQQLKAVSSTTLTVNGGVVVGMLSVKSGQEQVVINGPSGGGGNTALKKATIVE